jgi:uncharacterized peroxidase-related enzyme
VRYAGLGDGASSGQPEALAESAFSERQRVLVAFAEKLTIAPARITAADIEALRGAGLDDRGVLDACNTVAYFSYANRMTLGLGLETEFSASEP